MAEHTLTSPRPRVRGSSRRGAISRGCLIGLGVVLLIALVLGSTLVGAYNRLVGSQENAAARWTEIDNQYKRRFELIPQLVSTVQGAADFEKSTMEAVTEARASVGRLQLPAELPTDPQKLQAYLDAQATLGGALQRLLVVAEQYPQLKASASFLALQDQLEGTANRITVATRDYIDAVQSYNTGARRFPANLIAGIFNFEKLAQPTLLQEGERAAPKVEFQFDK